MSSRFLFSQEWRGSGKRCPIKPQNESAHAQSDEEPDAGTSAEDAGQESPAEEPMKEPVEKPCPDSDMRICRLLSTRLEPLIRPSRRHQKQCQYKNRSKTVQIMHTGHVHHENLE